MKVREVPASSRAIHIELLGIELEFVGTELRGNLDLGLRLRPRQSCGHDSDRSGDKSAEQDDR